MTWNSLRISAAALVLCAGANLFVLTAPVLAQDASTNASVAPATIPNTGQTITPTAALGSTYVPLTTGLADNPTWVAGQAVSSVISPDGKTLLVLTSGYNRVYYTTGPFEPISLPLPSAANRNAADSNEYVFVYDISLGVPIQKQVIQVANTYSGIAFDPSGIRFYVSGGVNDNVHIFTLQMNRWIEQPGSPVALGHSSGVGLGVAPAAAGVAVSQDGTKIVVANYYNDSISVLGPNGNGAIVKTAELDLRPGIINPAQSGVPGGEYPYWVTIKGSTTAYVSSIRDREIDVVDLTGCTPSACTPTLTTRIKVTGQPLKSVLNPALTTLYVAEDQNDSVAVINTLTNTLVTEATAVAPPSLLPSSRSSLNGANTNSVALSPDGSKLYVTNGNHNDVAVLNVASLGTGNAVIGLIPTGWYPTSVTFSANGKQLYVTNYKTPTGPNPGWCYGDVVPSLPATQCNASNQYALQLIKGGVLSMPVPDTVGLGLLTLRVAANNHFLATENASAAATMAFLHSKIQHIIYIIKENKTFDQILGDLGIGAGDPGLTEFGAAVTPNEHALAQNFVTLDHFFDSSEVSMDGWPWSTSARAPDVVEKQVSPEYAGRGLSYDSEGTNRNINVSDDLATRVLQGAPNDPNVLPETTDTAAPDGPANQVNTGYIWNNALRAGLTVRDYGFFFNNVGPAMLDYFTAGTIAGYSADLSLHPYTDPYFRGFDVNVPDYYREQEWERDLAVNGLANLTLIRLGTDHTGDFSTALAGLNTPSLQVAGNDYAVGLVVQKIASIPAYANNTLVFVIEDDAQNGGDHIDAHRSIAFIAGPYVKQKNLVSTPYNTVNFIRTMEEILGLGPLNFNDSIAQPMADVFDTTLSPWTYTATFSPLLCNSQLPVSCSSSAIKQARAMKEKHNAAYWARVTKGMDFSKEDLVDAETFNRILWKGIMGSKPYPGDVSGYKPSKSSKTDSDD
jgi:YVTN family beta-propeller protein